MAVHPGMMIKPELDERGISQKEFAKMLGTQPSHLSVSTICVGMAASMGAFLLSSGAKGKRIALPNAEIMIHQPSAGTQGKVTDMEIDVEHFLKVKERINKILAENTGKTAEQVKADSERDRWLSAEEAREYGLIDKVIYKR